MKIHKTNNHQKKQQVFMGAAERTFRVLDAVGTDLTEEVTRTPSSISSWNDNEAENSRGYSLLDTVSTQLAGSMEPSDGEGEEYFDYDGYEDDDDDDEDDDDDDASNFSDFHGPINAVESFFEELAEVKGNQTFGGLVLNLSACNAELTNSEDDFSVECPLGASQRQRGRSTSPRPMGPPDSIHATASTISETILEGLQMAADAILEINADNASVTTPQNSGYSFFKSLFNCNR
jgi:hypothetical protein